jgi:hypothetical protein
MNLSMISGVPWIKTGMVMAALGLSMARSGLSAGDPPQEQSYAALGWQTASSHDTRQPADSPHTQHGIAPGIRRGTMHTAGVSRRLTGHMASRLRCAPVSGHN